MLSSPPRGSPTKKLLIQLSKLNRQETIRHLRRPCTCHRVWWNKQLSLKKAPVKTVMVKNIQMSSIGSIRHGTATQTSISLAVHELQRRVLCSHLNLVIQTVVGHQPQLIPLRSKWPSRMEQISLRCSTRKKAAQRTEGYFIRVASNLRMTQSQPPCPQPCSSSHSTSFTTIICPQVPGSIKQLRNHTWQSLACSRCDQMTLSIQNYYHRVGLTTQVARPRPCFRRSITRKMAQKRDQSSSRVGKSCKINRSSMSNHSFTTRQVVHCNRSSTIASLDSGSSQATSISKQRLQRLGQTWTKR